MILRELWTLVRDTARMVRRLPDLIADWCDRQVLAIHRPVMVPADDPAEWPNGEMPWCLRCDVAWPCETAAEVSERMTGRRS